MGLVGAVISAVYCFQAKPVYETVASVVIYRNRVENPNSVSEEAKNRWVWVRDGLTITEGLLPDDYLEEVVSKLPELQKRYDRYKTRLLTRHTLETPDDEMPVFLQRIRQQIKIDYTGGDSNTFVFTVKDRSQPVARYLAESIIARLKAVWIDELRNAYTEALALIATDAAKAGPESSSMVSRSYLRNTYNGLLVQSRLNQATAEKNFQIVRRPSYPVAPIWPKPMLILLVGTVSGLVLGLFLSYLRSSVYLRA